MRRSWQPWLKLALSAFLLTVFATSPMATLAQSAPAQKRPAPAPDSQPSKDPEAVRSELFDLLRLSPKFTTVIAADPSLLADEAYVTRNNPELADFLRSHPEVVRSPEFYLVVPRNLPGGGRQLRFEADVWPGRLDLLPFGGPPNNGRNEERIVVFLVFVLILGALLWIFHIVLENNKWNRLSKMQNDLYGKLLDKCSTNEELLAAFRTSAGKPLFDLASIEPRTASPLNRVFLPLQFGIVLTVAGGGLLSFLYARAFDARVFLGLGTLVFALGIGLMISAVVSYLLARHLGLLPRPGKANETSASASANASASG